MIPHLSERVLILAPHGRDAAIAAAVLGEAGRRAVICPSLAAVVEGLEQGAGCGVLTEEGLKSADLNPLASWITNQREWSDFPFILLTHKGGGLERNPAAKRFLDILGNVTFLERPFHPTTLLSLVESALRGRRRQYDARSRLEELHRGADKYRSLFESIEAGFCIIEMQYDAAGKPFDYILLEANPAFERQTGLSNVVGKSIRSLVPSHEQHWFDIYGEIARTGERRRFEDRADALGGYWYEVYAFRVGEPEARRVAVLFNDISERRRMEIALRDNEDRLRRLNETLEERVIERTKALENTQDALRQSQKLESIGQLTGGIAHDFNNLLMAIAGSLSLLERRVPNDPKLHHLISNALQGVERGAALTQRMLAFARRQDLSTEAIDVRALLNGMNELLERTLGPAWTLDLRVSNNLPPVLADANQLEMALLNLAVNARDAMADGGLIQILAEEQAVGDDNRQGLAAGAYVTLSVVDSGHGMDAATLERATEPFFTTKGVGKGTGLGLPMIHGLAKQLGGAFILESRLNEGTRATLWLPAGTPSLDEVAGAPILIDTTPAVGALHILAVDDDALILMNTCTLLRDLGHEVLEAASGQEGLALIQDNPDIDLLITDQAMPNMTGMQLVEQIHIIRPELPIIIASGYAELPPEFEGNIVKLTKPYTPNQLERAVTEAVARRRMVPA